MEDDGKVRVGRRENPRGERERLWERMYSRTSGSRRLSSRYISIVTFRRYETLNTLRLDLRPASIPIPLCRSFNLRKPPS